MNLFLIFQYGLVGLLVVLVTLFSSVMFCETCTEWVGQRLGLHTKNPILKFLGIGMGGVLLALQAMMSYKRARALEDTANAQAEAAKAQAKATEEQAKANQNTEKGQRQERLKNAIEHLGHTNASVRLGGAYELFHLAEDTNDLRKTVLDILCSHIRRTTGEGEYRQKYELEPSEEIQSLLTLLFVQDHEVFKGLRINLRGSWLNGAGLTRARLEKAILTRAHLRSANLVGASLQRANLVGASLQGANLRRAFLQRADLREAFLQGANLARASLQGVYFGRAFLQGANLVGASLQGAYLVGTFLQRGDRWRKILQDPDLRETPLQMLAFREASLQRGDRWDISLQESNIEEASLQESNLEEAFLQESNLEEASLQDILSQNGSSPSQFAGRIRWRIDLDTDLFGVVFAGGLSRKAVDFIVKDLSDEEAKHLREKLKPHIDQPVSYELPEDSDAITGTYTAKEAEQWIAEYEEVMSVFNEADDN